MMSDFFEKIDNQVDQKTYKIYNLRCDKSNI